MTLEEEIKRYTDNAEYERTHGNLQGCLDFRQLAEWLRELKKYREKENCNKPYWAEMEVLTDVYDIMGDKTWASKMRCSNCNFITYAIEGKFSQYNYCPQCGVKIGVTLEEVNADVY